MSGFDGARDWKGNLELFAQRFAPICDEAQGRGLQIALENWMALGGPPPQKPGNFGGGPAIWDALFEAVPSEVLGLEFDPSHLYWQGIDHIRALREYAPRVFHVHAKDTEMLPEERYRWGAYAAPFRFRIPGYGEIDWTRFVATLDEIGYTGGVAIEHEDPIYSGDRFDEGLVRGHAVLSRLVQPTG
jgi:sugar phosphate isomerase/epimerase